MTGVGKEYRAYSTLRHPVNSKKWNDKKSECDSHCDCASVSPPGQRAVRDSCAVAQIWAENMCSSTVNVNADCKVVEPSPTLAAPPSCMRIRN